MPEKLNINKLRDKLMTARCRLISVDQWYGTMASLMEWHPDTTLKTMGVHMKASGKVDAGWNPAFVDKLPVESLVAVIQHEVEHIVRLHPVRWFGKMCRAIKDGATPLLSWEHEPWNIAADMIINGPEKHPNIDNLPQFGKCKPVFYVHEKPNLTTEELFEEYRKLMPNIRISCPMCNGSGKVKKSMAESGGQGQQGQQGQGQQNGQQNGQGGQAQGQNQDSGNKKSGLGPDEVECPWCGGQGHTDGRVFLDDHSAWSKTTAGEDQARQIVREMVEKATKRAGFAPGHLDQAIQALKKPKIQWRNELKQYVGKQVGMRRKTWSRRSRREDRFGVKGVSSHGSTSLTVCVDTSGSVSDDMLRQFFGELELMSAKFKITLVQFDAAIQSVDKYRRGGWKKIKIHGRGGTSFIDCIEGIKEKKIVGKVNLILTDGYAQWPKEQPFPVLWCIIGKRGEHPKPDWGRVLTIDY